MHSEKMYFRISPLISYILIEIFSFQWRIWFQILSKILKFSDYNGFWSLLKVINDWIRWSIDVSMPLSLVFPFFSLATTLSSLESTTVKNLRNGEMTITWEDSFLSLSTINLLHLHYQCWNTTLRIFAIHGGWKLFVFSKGLILCSFIYLYIYWLSYSTACCLH